MHQKVIDILVKEDDFTWKSVIINLVKEQGMDPWDIDISLLSHQYIEMLKVMKEMNLSVSGKVLLAAAILLNIKSKRFVGEDISEWDRMATTAQDPEDEFFEDSGFLPEDIGELERKKIMEQVKKYGLIPRTPQPRKRKVSIYDLVIALNKALEVEQRRVVRREAIPIPETPQKKYDISELITSVYDRIKTLFSKENKEITFSQLLPSEEKEAKILTFIPLLHLTNQRKIDLEQKQSFGEIYISLLDEKKKEAKIEG